MLSLKGKHRLPNNSHENLVYYLFSINRKVRYIPRFLSFFEEHLEIFRNISWYSDSSCMFVSSFMNK